jgi:hypothetical protein
MTEKKKNWFARHKVLTVILVLFLLIGFGSALGGGDKTTTDNKESTKQETKKDTKAEIGLNQPANDGKFEFTVTGIKCGTASVGSNQFLTKAAQGQFCLLNVTVKNVGNEKQSLFSTNQKLLAGDKEYSADDTATIYNAPNGTSWYSDINPGNSVTGAIVFDVPKDVTPTHAELHDSAFSGGVKVKLQ